MTPLEVALFSWPDYHVLEELVRTATGPLGLVIIAIYSFLIAFILPLPSEVVLFPNLHLGLPRAVELTIVIVVSGLGKAAGSVFAFAIGHGVKESGPVIKLLRRSPVDIVAYSERKTVDLARNYGYIGLAMALSVPFFPDTLSIYAFSVLEEDYLKFAAATFAGSVGRLLVTLGLFGIGASIF
ncbi:YqaA family protein [Halorarius litoreus]|uniref:YqaA family protein n=1 Tax=Halorarius litoreus TaxID=2962676 RepID=UPI0020CDAA4D|nr:VTT domain-containing protein [Halorarius litoreus]